MQADLRRDQEYDLLADFHPHLGGGGALLLRFAQLIDMPCVKGAESQPTEGYWLDGTPAQTCAQKI